MGSHRLAVTVLRKVRVQRHSGNPGGWNQWMVVMINGDAPVFLSPCLSAYQLASREKEGNLMTLECWALCKRRAGPIDRLPHQAKDTVKAG